MPGGITALCQELPRQLHRRGTWQSVGRHVVTRCAWPHWHCTVEAVEAPFVMLPAAKNVILAGVKSVTLHDAGEATLRDLSSQFYLTKAGLLPACPGWHRCLHKRT